MLSKHEETAEPRRPEAERLMDVPEKSEGGQTSDPLDFSLVVHCAQLCKQRWSWSVQVSDHASSKEFHCDEIETEFSKVFIGLTTIMTIRFLLHPKGKMTRAGLMNQNITELGDKIECELGKWKRFPCGSSDLAHQRLRSRLDEDTAKSCPWSPLIALSL